MLDVDKKNTTNIEKSEPVDSKKPKSKTQAKQKQGAFESDFGTTQVLVSSGRHWTIKIPLEKKTYLTFFSSLWI